MLPTLSSRQKAGLAVALALLMWAPMGVSHGDHAMLTGHSTFYNGEVYDPCLGSIAGILRHRVMWFNDQVLVESYGGKGTFIYVTENGAPDPRGMTLRTDGVSYDFVDPNGAFWHVEESYIPKTATATVNTNPIDNHEDPLVTTHTDQWYVWTVELASRPIYDQYAGDDPHTFYNFLILVDTCKMHRNELTRDGMENHTLASGKLNDRNGHPNDAEEHDHERWMVNIYAGKRPVILPGGFTTNRTEWESDWAGSQARQAAPEDGPDNGMPELP